MANSLELDRLKRFSEIVINSLPRPDDRGAAVHIQLLEAVGRAMSVKAARMLVSDLLEWTQDLVGDSLLSLDRALSEQNLPTLSLMRSRQDADLAAVLRRGRISTDDEYRLVYARLADIESVLSDADRALAEKLLAGFPT